jgi:hypothetical protein
MEDVLPPSPTPPEPTSEPPVQLSPLPSLAPQAVAPTPESPLQLTPPSPSVTLEPSPESFAYKDRSTGLTIFGVFQIVLGLFAALMIPLAALGAFMSHFVPGGVSMRPGQFISGIASYAFAFAGLLTLGIGSVRMKRWARALTLVTSWYWLIMGVLITILLTAVMPLSMRGALAQTRQNTPNAPSPEFTTGIMAVFVTFIIVFAAFFLVVVPIAFVVFYGRKDVELTCRHRDPVERWTDRAPLPVLGASVVMCVGALYSLVVGVTTPLFPFFGQYLTGIAGAACFLVLAALDGYLSVGIFRLQSSAWWIAIVIAPLRLLSMIVTYSKADLMQAYSKIGFSDAEMQMMSSNPMFRGHVILWWSLFSMILFFGYLLWLKRYFKTPIARQSDPLPA